MNAEKPGEVELTWGQLAQTRLLVLWKNGNTRSLRALLQLDASGSTTMFTIGVMANEVPGKWTDFPGEVTGTYTGTVTGLSAKTYRFMVRARKGQASTSTGDIAAAFPNTTRNGHNKRY